MGKRRPGLYTKIPEGLGTSARGGDYAVAESEPRGCPGAHEYGPGRGRGDGGTVVGTMVFSGTPSGCAFEFDRRSPGFSSPAMRAPSPRANVLDPFGIQSPASFTGDVSRDQGHDPGLGAFGGRAGERLFQAASEQA